MKGRELLLNADKGSADMSVNPKFMAGRGKWVLGWLL